jgi:hypothetical protein
MENVMRGKKKGKKRKEAKREERRREGQEEKTKKFSKLKRKTVFVQQTPSSPLLYLL